MPRVVDADEQRNLVIDAAWSVIIDEGFGGATMRAIATRAGCTTGLVTHYFSSKEDLLLQMVRQTARVARDRIDRARAGQTGLDALRSIVIESAAIAPEMVDEWRIWVALWDHSMTNSRLRSEWRRRSEGWKKLVREGLEDAVQIGQLAADTPVEHIVAELSTLHHGLSVSSILAAERISTSQVIRILDEQLRWIETSHPGPALGVSA